MKVLIHVGCCIFGTTIFVLLSYAITGSEGTPYALPMGLLDYLLFYFLPAYFLCKAYDRRKNSKDCREKIKKTKQKESLVEIVAKKSDRTIIAFANRVNKIPSDAAIIARLYDLTAGSEEHRQLSKNWSRANEKLSELKKADMDLMDTTITDLAIEAAKYFLLFLYDFDSKMGKCNEKTATEKLRNFLADIEPMYK